jgi:hypothetical protein
MTIRDYIKRRFNRIVVITVVPVLTLFLASPFGFEKESPVTVTVLALLLFAATAILSVALLRTRCPRCSKPLGYSALAVGVERQYVLTRCPHCGISFDEPRESPANPN